MTFRKALIRATKSVFFALTFVAGIIVGGVTFLTLLAIPMIAAKEYCQPLFYFLYVPYIMVTILIVTLVNYFTGKKKDVN